MEQVDVAPGALQKQYRDELVALRDRRGINVEKVAQSAPGLMAHQAVDEELRRLGLTERDRAGAAMSVIECFARADHWEARARAVLVKTLNFDLAPGMLDSRRADLMIALGVGDTAYRNYEEEAFGALAHRFVRSTTSPCVEPLSLLAEQLTLIALDQAITFAGLGDREIGTDRVRALLQRQVPVALALFSSPRDHAAADQYPLQTVLERMLGVLALTDYNDALYRLRSRGYPQEFAVLPAPLVMKLVGLYYDADDTSERIRELATEAERRSATMHRPEGGTWHPYLHRGSVTSAFHRMVDNTAGILAKLIVQAEVTGAWRMLITRARTTQENNRTQQAAAGRSGALVGWVTDDSLMWNVAEWRISQGDL